MRTRKRRWAIAGWGGLLMHAALAQDAVEMGTIAKIEVTGSHIPRPDSEAALPVQVINREEILRAGWTTAAELMAHVSANFNGMNDQLSVGSGNPGLSSANLRGLGDGNTLVLLNGRRLANYAFLGGTVDIASIPLAALDRVEILKDGASAIYGTDAIAGVVNFITRKDFRGVELTGRAAITEHGGGDHTQATVTAGFGDPAKHRFNAFITLDWQKDTVLSGTDRPFSRTAYRPDEGLDRLSPNGVVPANILPSDGRVLNPGFAAGCDPPLSLAVPRTFFPRLGPQPVCQYDPAPLADILPASERWNMLARGTWQFTPGHQLFAEYVYADKKLPLRIAPTPILPFGPTPLIYPAGGPYYPTAFAQAHALSGDLALLYRTLTLGRRVDEIRTRSHRALVGVEGALGRWDYNIAYNHSENSSRQTLASGYVFVSKLVAALATGLVNPFGPFGAEGQALLEAAQIFGEVRRAKGTLDQLDMRVAGDLTRLPGGPLAAAFGAEARREKLIDRPAAALDSGDIGGFGSAINPQDASRDVRAAFVEFSVPMVSALEAQISTRYDHYSDFGGTTNPKLALRWQPVKSLLLRASWGKGFRAPTLPDLHTPQQSDTSFGYEDPLRCPITGLLEDCGARPYRVRFGGNPALVPEHSKQWTAGMVYEPARAASIAIDYWNIRKTAVIGALNSDLIFANYDAFGPTNVVRGPVDPAFPDLPGPIVETIEWNQNVGNNETSGIDVGLRLRSEATRAGRFAFDLDGTYVIEWTEHLTGLPPRSVEGGYLFAPVPRWRHYARVGWEQGPWTATLGQRFQSGYTDAKLNAAGEKRRVGTYALIDLQASYTGLRSTTLAFGIRNLFDRAPPFTNQINAFQVGYDPNYGDPRGRTFYARVSYAFQ